MSLTADKMTKVTHWIALAATPCFAAMALLSACAAPSPDICMANRTVLPLDGMTMMYMLMGLFHSPPWLRLAWHRSPSKETA